MSEVKKKEGESTDKHSRKGVLHLDKNVKSCRNPKAQNKTNAIRNRLNKEDKKSFKFKKIVSMNAEWEKYYQDKIKINSKHSKHDKSILKADYHGALLTVWVADNPTQIGTSGIVVLETRNTFQMVTEDDRFVVIPKQGTVFRFIINDRLFTLFGEGMRTRPAWRGKKPRVKRALPTFIRGSLVPNSDCSECNIIEKNTPFKTN